MTDRFPTLPGRRSSPAGSRATHNEERQILTVGSLARQARVLLEERFHLIWVEGEISNLAQPRSGHWYFTLKDSDAQIRCAMFAGRNRTVRFPVRNGLKVLLRGRISLYEARGDFQIIAEHLEPAGEGALRAAYETLKLKLDDEGLFAAERKRTLPAAINRVAVISSTSGAALR
ncbi:MAG: exodeoxyribonuclease VII large subunit, partial [Pseudomonadales bacterium]